MTPEEMQQYVTAMREGGVLSFKHEGLEIVLGPMPIVVGKQPAPKPQPTYDQLLFACTEGLPEDE